MTFKIAFRNTLRQRRRTILTALTMFGGFTLAAISIGWSDGTYNFIINMFTRNRLGHIQIHTQGYQERPSIYKTIDEYKSVGQKIQKIRGVESWAPRLYSAGLASVRDKTTGVQIIGIDPFLENQATRFHKKVLKGQSFSGTASHEVLLGIGLADILKAQINDEIVIVSQAADGSIANDLYKIVGFVKTGDDMSDRTSFYLHLQDAQDLLVLNSRIHEIVVIANELDAVEQVAMSIKQQLNPKQYNVQKWQEFAKSFYQAMQADREGMWIMLFVIVLVVAVGVLNTVLMSVLERRREYGLLKAIGTKPGQIVMLVISEINVIALASVVIGIVLSIIMNYILSIYGISLPEPFTYGGIKFQTMYSAVTLKTLYVPTITVFVTATVVSVFPAIKAAKTEPAKAMRIQ